MSCPLELVTPDSLGVFFFLEGSVTLCVRLFLFLLRSMIQYGAVRKGTRTPVVVPVDHVVCSAARYIFFLNGVSFVIVCGSASCGIKKGYSED